MPKTREQKKEIIENLKRDFENQKIAIFVDIKGISAKELFDLREKLKEKTSLLKVVKKTLLEIAAKEKKIDLDFDKLKGQLALVFGFDDPIFSSKTVNQFSSKNENLKILGAFFENRFISKEEVIELAKLSSREEILAQLVGSISSPISRFVNALQSNIKGLIFILKQLKPAK